MTSADDAAEMTVPADPQHVTDAADVMDAVDAVGAVRPRPPLECDPVAAAAVELARAAAQEIAEPATVGEHLGVHADAPGVVTHAFACLARGYHGWYWAITVVNAPGDDAPTVSDTVLLPGGEAILAPVWVPWSDRLAPGDLRATDVLAFRADDPYLEPGYTVTDDAEADAVALGELGLGRARVLGPQGRAEAARRWYAGDRGPTADEAIHAAAPCSTCGYFLLMAGALRQVFGVCGNEWSPSDGRVVSVDHGCGAHSETDLDPVEPLALPEPILDDLAADVVLVERREPDGDPADRADADAAEPAADEPAADEPAADEPAADADEQSVDIAAEPVEAPAPTP